MEQLKQRETDQKTLSENSKMFILPNKPSTAEKIRWRQQKLKELYHRMVQQENIKSEIKSKINGLFLTQKINNIHEFFETASQEYVSELARNIRYFPEIIREEIAHMLLERAPQESASELARNIGYFPETLREEISYLDSKTKCNA